jgi:hypothetical protein
VRKVLGLYNKTILFVLCMLVILPFSGSLYAVRGNLSRNGTAHNDYLADRVKPILFLATRRCAS